MPFKLDSLAHPSLLAPPWSENKNDRVSGCRFGGGGFRCIHEKSFCHRWRRCLRPAQNSSLLFSDFCFPLGLRVFALLLLAVPPPWRFACRRVDPSSTLLEGPCVPLCCCPRWHVSGRDASRLLYAPAWARRLSMARRLREKCALRICSAVIGIRPWGSQARREGEVVIGPQ